MPAPVDKARQAALQRVEAALKDLDAAYATFGDAKDASGATKDVKAMRARVEKAKADPSPAGTKALDALVKDIKALVVDFEARVRAIFSSNRRRELTGLVNGKLAGALLQIGKIQDPMVTRMLFAEQAALRARMDKAEKVRDDLEAVGDMDDIDDEMPKLEQRIEGAIKLGSWLAVNYRAMRELIARSVKAVPVERCRKLLEAELDLVEQAKNDALKKLDAKAAQNATLPGLRLVQKVAARLAAELPALDRELVRVGKLVREAGAPADTAARLKKLVEEKTRGFPQVHDAHGLEAALDAFAKQLAELAASAGKAGAKAGAKAAAGA